MEREILLKIVEQFRGMYFDDLTKLERTVFGLLKEAGLVRLVSDGLAGDDRIIEKVV